MLFSCIGTPKLISKRRLLDGNVDCYQATDENTTHLCTSVVDIPCAVKGNCIPDESSLFRSHCMNIEIGNLGASIGTPFVWHRICNKYVDINEPVLVDTLNETDETNCDLWPCNNLYTRCDGAWHCSNGIDELNCTSEYQCPPDHHPCISPKTIELTCLPVHRAADGIIDCLGATDEREHCRQSYPENLHIRYRCWNDTKCIEPCSLCGTSSCDQDICPNENLEEVCGKFAKSSLAKNYRDQCGRDAYLQSPMFEFFSLTDTNDYLSTAKLNPITMIWLCATRHEHSDERTDDRFELQRPKNDFNEYDIRTDLTQECNRGIIIQTNIENSTYCLCPPSYYGKQCQYQSQRVSLTLLFRRLVGKKHEAFSFIIELVDITGEIHAFEQIIYVPSIDCDTIYNGNLLYQNRRKDLNKNYAIRIVAYNIFDFVYFASWYFPINFLFLPVNRMSIYLIITRPKTLMNSYCSLKCLHGQCLKYVNTEEPFCHCDKGWYGRYCSVESKCFCSSQSYCHGWANNQSICVCSLKQIGPRCLIPSTCTTSNKCQNGGICVPRGKHGEYINQFTCLCPPEFTGSMCEIKSNQLIISFNNTDIPQMILLHFIQVHKISDPSRTTRAYKIALYEDMISFYPTELFNLLFAQIDSIFFLLITEEKQPISTIISAEINPFVRCPSVQELFHEEQFFRWPLLRRVKYYHGPCSQQPNLKCFHDSNTFMCLCNRYRQANCFYFDFNLTYNCRGLNDCENYGQCFDDHLTCPKSSTCVCSECFYGNKCQFSTKGFSLSLDAILSYHIRRHIPIAHQPAIVKFTLAMTMLMFVVGFISSTLSMITFRSKKTREVGSGLYLFVSSSISLLVGICFTIKFWFLLVSQINTITNRTILLVNCLFSDFILRLFLSVVGWLHTCVSFERLITVVKGVHFDKVKSRRISSWIVLVVILATAASLVHDPTHRHLIDDEDDERVWCITRFTTHTNNYDSVISILHFVIPLCINLISAIVIIVLMTKQRSISNKRQTKKEHFTAQFQQHKHLLVSPLLLALLAIPRLIISFLAGCLKSPRNPWIFLCSYIISYIAPFLTFFVFILPSEAYKRHFYEEIRRIKTSIQRFLPCN